MSCRSPSRYSFQFFVLSLSLSIYLSLSLSLSLSLHSIDLTPPFYFADFHPIPLAFSFLSPHPSTILYLIPCFPILHPAPFLPPSSNRRKRTSHLPPSRKPTPSKNPLLTHPYTLEAYSLSFFFILCLILPVFFLDSSLRNSYVSCRAPPLASATSPPPARTKEYDQVPALLEVNSVVTKLWGVSKCLRPFRKWENLLETRNVLVWSRNLVLFATSAVSVKREWQSATARSMWYRVSSFRPSSSHSQRTSQTLSQVCTSSQRLAIFLSCSPHLACSPYSLLFNFFLIKVVNYTGLFISPSGISELDCATTKTDTAERSISIGRESLQVFFLY